MFYVGDLDVSEHIQNVTECLLFNRENNIRSILCQICAEAKHKLFLILHLISSRGLF